MTPNTAPAAAATVHPGVQTYTNGGQCTANFIYTAGSDIYIGQAAHCSSTGEQTDTDGCLAASLPNDIGSSSSAAQSSAAASAAAT